MDNVRLARNWSKGRVLECLTRDQRYELIRFLRERYSERFFRPIRCLREAPGNEQGYGFAITALCCLLVETIQCYREGVPTSSDGELGYLEKLPLNSNAPADYKLVRPWPFAGGSTGAFKSFFSNSQHREYFPDVDGKEFYEKIRCGLLHQAQTKGTWRLVRTGKFWDASEKSINRDEFAVRLEECFDGYLEELNQRNWNEHIWKLARRRIWWVAQLS